MNKLSNSLNLMIFSIFIINFSFNQIKIYNFNFIHELRRKCFFYIGTSSFLLGLFIF